MKYQHIFFDLDHTLWDFAHNAKQTLAQLYAEYMLEKKTGIGFDKFYQGYAYHNERLWEAYRHHQISRDELQWKRMWLALQEINYPDESLAIQMGEYFLKILPRQSQLMPGSKEILDYLKSKDYHLHILTNGFPEIQELKLQSAGIDRYFDHVITSAEAGCLKPDLQFFLYALKHTQADPNESLMIGDDMEVDIEGARQAGMDQVYFNPTGHLETSTATYTIKHLQELKQIL
ncbi:MAG: noncanonical pyrimidine nucleotidase, YjjG family [Thermoflavifilum aggregans]|nr:noncanonical pyrimidine nucleotidase, YjjG family [Thermoflavifilum aggregans]